MMWLVVIAGWFVGSILLAALVGTLLSGMARADAGTRTAPALPSSVVPLRASRATSSGDEVVRAA